MRHHAAVIVAVIVLPFCGASFPPCGNVVDVTKPPYTAKADGVSDDTESLQRALNENTGRHRVLYFPRGTYLVSSTLTWPKQFGGRDNWGMTYLCGESRETTMIRLKDATFADATKPQAIMWCGGFGSADWFHNYVENLTFHVGAGNPGAIALQFYSNNSGAVRDCRFVANADSGHRGLDLMKARPSASGDSPARTPYRRWLRTARSADSAAAYRIQGADGHEDIAWLKQRREVKE
jgi:hypothetical protein